MKRSLIRSIFCHGHDGDILWLYQNHMFFFAEKAEYIMIILWLYQNHMFFFAEKAEYIMINKGMLQYYILF